MVASFLELRVNNYMRVLLLFLILILLMSAETKGLQKRRGGGKGGPSSSRKLDGKRGKSDRNWADLSGLKVEYF